MKTSVFIQKVMKTSVFTKNSRCVMDLIINTYGVSINRDNEALVVTTPDGTRQRIPTTGIKSIQISRGAQITSDAVMLAIEQEIEVLFMDKSGSPIGRVWSPRYGSISTIRKGQVNFTFSPDAVKWIKDVVARKIENQQALILSLSVDSADSDKAVERTLRRLEDYRNKILLLEGEIVPDVAASLRGWEGQASKIYFDTLNAFIPEHLRFAIRSQRPALDVANAMLNYGYGILYGKIEGCLIKAGIDPYIGILHRDDYNRPVLVYDIIELYRVWVDYVVYALLAQDIITDEFYSARPDGSYWLEPLGRRIVIQSLNDYLEEVVDGDGANRRSRSQQIFLYVQNLAQQFKQFCV